MTPIVTVFIEEISIPSICSAAVEQKIEAQMLT